MRLSTVKWAAPLFFAVIFAACIIWAAFFHEPAARSAAAVIADSAPTIDSDTKARLEHDLREAFADEMRRGLNYPPPRSAADVRMIGRVIVVDIPSCGGGQLLTVTRTRNVWPRLYSAGVTSVSCLRGEHGAPPSIDGPFGAGPVAFRAQPIATRRSIVMQQIIPLLPQLFIYRKGNKEFGAHLEGADYRDLVLDFKGCNEGDLRRLTESGATEMLVMQGNFVWLRCATGGASISPPVE